MSLCIATQFGDIDTPDGGNTYHYFLSFLFLYNLHKLKKLSAANTVNPTHPF